MTLARSTLTPSFLLAALLHGVVLGWVATRPSAPPRRPARPPTTVRLVERPRPPEPPRPAEPKPRPPPPTGRPLALATKAAPAPTPEAPPPPGPPPTPRRFAVSMDAVAPAGAGGVAMPTTAGRTAALGNPTLPSSAPVGDNTPFARAAADVTEVDRAPRLLRQPSSLDMRALYPEAARRDGVEGDVRLELLIAETGGVADVRILEQAGHGFDEVAAVLARRIAFAPAVRAGRPVAVRIAWTLKFRLDG